MIYIDIDIDIDIYYIIYVYTYILMGSMLPYIAAPWIRHGMYISWESPWLPPRLERVAVPGRRLRVDLTSAILGTGELENIPSGNLT